MCHAVPSPIMCVMTESDEIARLHDEENRAQFAINKKEHEMEAVERAMERELKAFEEDERAAVRRIDEERRREHFKSSGDESADDSP